MESLEEEWEQFLNNENHNNACVSGDECGGYEYGYGCDIGSDDECHIGCEDKEIYHNNPPTTTKESEDTIIERNILNGSNIKTPICSDIYISTTTKIVYLNQAVDIYNLFWDIPVIEYHKPQEGVIKKQIKITCFTQEETDAIQEKVSEIPSCKQQLISFHHNPKSKAKINYKHVQKINVGISKKDILSYRMKDKGAFYNCFALIFRVSHNNEYKEIHVKVFNTGKLEIPGIQSIEILDKTLALLMKTLEPFVSDTITYQKDNIDTVLINSNFNCGYYVNREKLYNKLKYTYNLICMYDPCSYPGVQCKFYYNETKDIQDGICQCQTKCSKKGSGTGEGQCLELSFMIFRTGSILIVGHCDERKLYKIYDYIKNILQNEWIDLFDGKLDEIKPKTMMNKKIKYITIEVDNTESQ